MAKDKDKNKKNGQRGSGEPVEPAEAASSTEGAEAEASVPGSGSATSAPETETHSEDGDTADIDALEDLIEAEGPDVETPTVETLTEEEVQFIEEGEKDLVAEMRNDMLRAQADLVNFRTRVERDRVATREAVIAEVIRTLLPAIDDLARAETHGDLEGSPLELVAQKLKTAFEKYGLQSVGVKGEPFDPHFHEALVQVPSADVTVNTIAEVIETGYALGDRLIRAAKVAVLVPSE